MGRSWLPLVAAAVLAGCSVLDAADGTGASASADAASDAAPRADGQAAACALIDDFEDGAIAGWWDSDGDDNAHAREAGGALEVSFADTSESWAGYILKTPIDLTAGTVEVEVRNAGGAYTGVEVCFDDMELELYAEDIETLIGEVSGTDASDDTGEIAFWPGIHLRWRIRTQDGVVYWEVSEDGQAWEPIHSQPFPFPLDAVTIMVGASGVLGDPPATFESFAAFPTGCAE